MVDEKRIDLGAELGGTGASDDLIADIKKAAGAEKKRIDAVQAREIKKVKFEASKKLYVIVAVVAAALLIAVAIFLNRPKAPRIQGHNYRSGAAASQPTVVKPIPGALPGRIAAPTNSQNAPPPPPPTEGYEQPTSPM